MGDAAFRNEKIIEDNSDGAVKSIKKFLLGNGSKKIQPKRDITSENGGKEIGQNDSRSNANGGEFDHAKRVASNDDKVNVSTSTMYYAGYVISVNDKNGLVFMEEGKENKQTVDDEDDDNVYTFDHLKRGYIIQVINDYQDRRGAAEDLRKMNDIGQKLGFECFNSCKTVNLTKQQMIHVLKQAQEIDHTDCDCFLFMISCHGANGQHGGTDEEDYGLLFTDEEIMYLGDIIRMFDDHNCPTLRGKPKLFFIQACRGPLMDDGNEIHVWKDDNDRETVKKECIKNCHTESGEPDVKTKNKADSGTYGHRRKEMFDNDEDLPVRLKCDNDMLVMFASPHRMMSWRNEETGSWLIHHLHEVFMNYNLTQPMSLLRLLTRVSGRISKLQTHVRDPSLDKKTVVPVIEHKLIKDILFSC